MSVQHDEKMLRELPVSLWESSCRAVTVPEKDRAIIAMTVAMKHYHEHMVEWRSLDELPEQGQRIEIAWRDDAGANPSWSTVDEFSGNFDDDFTHAVCGTPYAWRPAGGLPE